MDFSPFENESEVISIGGLTFENRLDRISLSGDSDITLDKAGLEVVQQLRELLALVETRMLAQPLPNEIAIQSVVVKPNPFA